MVQRGGFCWQNLKILGGESKLIGFDEQFLLKKILTSEKYPLRFFRRLENPRRSSLGSTI
jgi:hypothetical protein